MKKFISFLSTGFLFLSGGIGNLLFQPEVVSANPMIQFHQEVVDLNGGVAEVGDVLEYTITATNNSVDTLNNATIEDLLPLGTDYIANSLTIIGAGSGSITGDIAPIINYSQTTFEPGDQITMSYQVEVMGSPLYFVDNAARPAILYEVDKATGGVDTIDRIHGQRNVYGLALTSDARYVYGVNSLTDKAFYYDLVTKTTTELGYLDLGDVGVPCLDFDTNGVLWGADSREDFLFQIDLETGKGTKITDLEVDIKGGDCAFASDGQLYTVSNNNQHNKGALWVVNPTDGVSKQVSSISDTEFFTGIALGTTGSLFASGNKTDSLFSIDTTTGVGNSIGSFGVPHNGGDLAMTASQRLQMVSIAVYRDDEGNEITEEDGFEMEGDAPDVGDNEDISDNETLDPDVVWTEQKLCRILDGQTTCTFDDDFLPFARNYVDDVIEHHFGQVDAVAGDAMDALGLTGQAAINFLVGTASVIDTDREISRTAANAMVDQFILDYKDQEGVCPHENQLLEAIRVFLTHEQAKTSIKIQQYNAVDATAPVCALYGHDSAIRLGDTAILGWHTEYGTAATLEPYIGGIQLSSTYKIRPLETNTFQLDLYDDSGVVRSCEYEVVVEAACDVGAHKKVIYQGEGTSLIWNAEGHTVAEIDQIGGVSTKGQQYVTPSVTTKYTMNAYAHGATEPSKTCSYEIIVVDADKNILR